MTKILVTDDELELREMVEEYLTAAGYDVSCAKSAANARALVENQKFDIAILDVRMPGEDGLSLARHLREHYGMGIIMLTAACEPLDKVIGLEIGADDYMVKPFDPRELLARIKSLLRRVQLSRATPIHNSVPSQRVRFGLCLLDLECHKLTSLDGTEVPITSAEFDTLKAFAEHPNKTLTRERLLNLTQHRDWDPFDRSIDIRITRLRKKIEPDPGKPQVIKTIRNAGYLFVCEE